MPVVTRTQYKRLLLSQQQKQRQHVNAIDLMKKTPPLTIATTTNTTIQRRYNHRGRRELITNNVQGDCYVAAVHNRVVVCGVGGIKNGQVSNKSVDSPSKYDRRKKRSIERLNNNQDYCVKKRRKSSNEIMVTSTRKRARIAHSVGVENDRTVDYSDHIDIGKFPTTNGSLPATTSSSSSEISSSRTSSSSLPSSTIHITPHPQQHQQSHQNYQFSTTVQMQSSQSHQQHSYQEHCRYRESQQQPQPSTMDSNTTTTTTTTKKINSIKLKIPLLRRSFKILIENSKLNAILGSGSNNNNNGDFISYLPLIENNEDENTAAASSTATTSLPTNDDVNVVSYFERLNSCSSNGSSNNNSSSSNSSGYNGSCCSSNRSSSSSINVNVINKDNLLKITDEKQQQQQQHRVRSFTFSNNNEYKSPSKISTQESLLSASTTSIIDGITTTSTATAVIPSPITSINSQRYSPYNLHDAFRYRCRTNSFNTATPTTTATTTSSNSTTKEVNEKILSILTTQITKPSLQQSSLISSNQTFNKDNEICSAPITDKPSTSSSSSSTSTDNVDTVIISNNDNTASSSTIEKEKNNNKYDDDNGNGVGCVVGGGGDDDESDDDDLEVLFSGIGSNNRYFNYLHYIVNLEKKKVEAGGNCEDAVSLPTPNNDVEMIGNGNDGNENDAGGAEEEGDGEEDDDDADDDDDVDDNDDEEEDDMDDAGSDSESDIDSGIDDDFEE